MSSKKRVDVSLLIMILVIVAALVLGGFAIAPKVKTAIEGKRFEAMYERLNSNKGTVEDYANIYSGMKVDEFISTYGLKGQVTKDTLISEAVKKMTLKNYCVLRGVEYSEEALEEYKTENDAEITADTKDMQKKEDFVGYLLDKAQQEMNGEIGEDGQVIPADGEEVPADTEATTAPAAEATEAPKAE